MNAPCLRSALGRLAFALLSAAVLVVFSEKLYWYCLLYTSRVV